MKTFKLPSRYKDIETIGEILDENRVLITSNSRYTRHILDDNNENIEAIDFEGGPMLQIGNTLNNKKIKNIKYVYLIELG